MVDLIAFYRTERAAWKTMKFLGFNKQMKPFKLEILRSLIEQRKLFMMFPDNPSSSKRKYYSENNHVKA